MCYPEFALTQKKPAHFMRKNNFVRNLKIETLCVTRSSTGLFYPVLPCFPIDPEVTV